MRWIIKRAYSGQKWKNKVDCMSDEQVMAIYFRFERNGVDKAPVKKKVKAPQQLTLEGWNGFV